jgi:hypothetical protein
MKMKMDCNSNQFAPILDNSKKLPTFHHLNYNVLGTEISTLNKAY